MNEKETIAKLEREITTLKVVTNLIADGGVDALIEDNRKLRAALGHADAALAGFEKEFCNWEFEELGGYYKTKCGIDYDFDLGGPLDNKFKHCPGCGKEIVEVKK